MNTPLDDGGPVASIMTLGDKGEVVPVGGLSIRDWLAGMALGSAPVKEVSDFCERADAPRSTGMAAVAYRIADAMLAARKGKP